MRRGLVLAWAGLCVSACFMDGQYVVDVSDDKVRAMDSGSALADGGVPNPDALLSAASTVTSTAPAASTFLSHCSPGEIDGPGKICYVALTGVLAWKDAVAACAAQDGWGLLTVRDPQEHDVIKLILEGETWLGASDAEMDAEMPDRWQWLGDLEPFYVGSPGVGQPVNDAPTYWAPNEPSAATETERCAQYVRPSNEWFWDDTNCERELATLCEKR